MSWEWILSGLWTVINSAPGVMLMAGLLGLAMTKLYTIRPAWEAYEGTIISAIKHAEKAIPDDAPNKALARLDTALQYVLRVYEQLHGTSPSQDVQNDLREGIQIVHDRLETQGTL